MLRAEISIFTALLLSFPAVAAAEGGGERSAVRPSRDAIEERVTVRRVHWPIFVEPRHLGGGRADRCDRLDPSQLEVTEDGQPAVVTNVDHSPLPILHAILLDTSGSMALRLDSAKEAAIDYVRQLPPGERVMFASFDDRLTLRSPPTTDRERLEAAIHGIPLGQNTALWESLHDLLRYLEPIPALKSIVLLTDGEDNQSLASLPFERVMEAAASAPDLTIFPIGIDLPRIGDAEDILARNLLARIASSTGGHFFDIPDTRRLADVFQSIRARLERRDYVTYIPHPFGEGPHDDPAARASRWREVKVRARRGVPCRIVSEGPPVRLEGRPVEASGVLDPEPVSADDSTAFPASFDPCRSDDGPPRVVAKLRFPASEGWRDVPARDGWFYLLDPPRALYGRVLDVALGHGPLYDPEALGERGRYKLRADPVPSFTERVFDVEVPPLEEVVGAIRGPGDVLAFLARHRACPSAEVDEDAYYRAPVFVHGRTFLQMRRALGLALFRNFPAYREWAARRMVAESTPSIDRLIDELRRDFHPDPDALDTLRQVLLARAAEPDDDQPQRFLAGWLGDVPALEAASAYERDVANQLLRGRGSGERTSPDDEIERAWHAFRVWFPPPTAVRVLTPLVPSYDPARDVVGFYRILMPQPETGRPPADEIPPLPLGLSTVRWLLRQAGFEERARGRLLVGSIAYAPPSRSERGALEKADRTIQGDGAGMPRPRTWLKVSVTLEAAESPRRTLTVTGYYRGTWSPTGADSADAVPAAVRACAAGEAGEDLRRLARALAAGPLPSVIPCGRG